METPDPSDFAYQPVDSAVPVPSRERHTEEVTFRLSPRLARALEQAAEAEQTSVSEIVREALAVRWGIGRAPEFPRLLLCAAAALERTQIGDADEATAILEQAVTLDGRYRAR